MQSLVDDWKDFTLCLLRMVQFFHSRSLICSPAPMAPPFHPRRSWHLPTNLNLTSVLYYRVPHEATLCTILQQKHLTFIKYNLHLERYICEWTALSAHWVLHVKASSVMRPLSFTFQIVTITITDLSILYKIILWLLLMKNVTVKKHWMIHNPGAYDKISFNQGQLKLICTVLAT